MRRVAQAPTADATSRSRPLRALVKAVLSLVAYAALAGVASPAASAACPNEQFRAGPSANLPDCRAYELVTPTKVNAFPQAAMGSGNEVLRFSASPTPPSGDLYAWKVNPTGLPGTGSSGNSNLYQARRTQAGWTSTRMSPSASEAEGSDPGSFSNDQRYMLFQVEGFRGGSLAFCVSCVNIAYLRYPDATFHLFGEGTVPAEPDTDGYENGFIDDLFPRADWFTANGDHQIFESVFQLTPEAPAVATNQIYDRTSSGLALISLLPGDVPPSSDSEFAGSSADGSTVLFTNSGNLYARVDSAETLEIASGSLGEFVPGGVSADGSKAIYVQGGNVFAYDFEAEELSPAVSPGDAVLVNLSSDGSHVYFISETEIVPGQGTLGAPNLYVWNGSATHFIATVLPEDTLHGVNPPKGLGVWSRAFPGMSSAPAVNGLPIANTARTTPDGNILVFESRAQLTPYLNEGHIEIYRYDSVGEDLSCVSCSASQPAATADSELVADRQEVILQLWRQVDVPNLSTDGQTVVFDSKDALLPQDVNGVRDVYQWHAGTLSLISTGTSAQPSGLYGMTPSGNNVFFETGEKLVGKGQETGAIAIYDARIGGGLASQQTEESLNCVGEACQGEPGVPPSLAAPGSSSYRGRGNAKPRCHKRRGRHHRRKANASKKKKSSKRTCRSAGRRSGK